MVNENKGKVYEPVKHYNRKLLRGIIRESCIRNGGYHRVNERKRWVWRQLRDKTETENETV